MQPRALPELKRSLNHIQHDARSEYLSRGMLLHVLSRSTHARDASRRAVRVSMYTLCMLAGHVEQVPQII